MKRALHAMSARRNQSSSIKRLEPSRDESFIASVIGSLRRGQQVARDAGHSNFKLSKLVKPKTIGSQQSSYVDPVVESLLSSVVSKELKENKVKKCLFKSLINLKSSSCFRFLVTCFTVMGLMSPVATN